MEISLKKNYNREFLGEILAKFENILGCKSRAMILLIHDKYQTKKISCYSPFNQTVN